MSIANILQNIILINFPYDSRNAPNIIDASPIQQALAVASIKLNTGFGGMMNA